MHNLVDVKDIPYYLQPLNSLYYPLLEVAILVERESLKAAWLIGLNHLSKGLSETNK